MIFYLNLNIDLLQALNQEGLCLQCRLLYHIWNVCGNDSTCVPSVVKQVLLLKFYNPCLWPIILYVYYASLNFFGNTSKTFVYKSLKYRLPYIAKTKSMLFVYMTVLSTNGTIFMHFLHWLYLSVQILQQFRSTLFS